MLSSDAFFAFQDAQIMQKKTAKSRKHEKQEMPKAKHVSSLMMPGFGSVAAK